MVEAVTYKGISITPYNAKSKCPACGNDDIKISYRSAKEERQRPEHLKKQCGKCRYIWREHPKWAGTVEGY